MPDGRLRRQGTRELVEEQPPEPERLPHLLQAEAGAEDAQGPEVPELACGPGRQLPALVH